MQSWQENTAVAPTAQRTFFSCYFFLLANGELSKKTSGINQAKRSEVNPAQLPTAASISPRHTSGLLSTQEHPWRDTKPLWPGRGEQPHAGIPLFAQQASHKARTGCSGGKCNPKGCVAMLQCPPKAPAHFHRSRLRSDYGRIRTLQSNAKTPRPPQKKGIYLPVLSQSRQTDSHLTII